VSGCLYAGISVCMHVWSFVCVCCMYLVLHAYAFLCAYVCGIIDCVPTCVYCSAY